MEEAEILVRAVYEHGYRHAVAYLAPEAAPVVVLQAVADELHRARGDWHGAVPGDDAREAVERCCEVASVLAMQRADAEVMIRRGLLAEGRLDRASADERLERVVRVARLAVSMHLDGCPVSVELDPEISRPTGRDPMEWPEAYWPRP